MNLCFYHNDADGRSSGAIVRRALGPGTRLQEINYGDPVPWEAVEKAEHVIMVDFSLSLAEMERLARGRRFTWIDHHISAINSLQEAATHWEGLRDLSEAACVLTWRYYYPNLPVPQSILLIGDRDIWANLLPDSAAFGEGLNQQNAHPENDQLWTPLLDDDPQAVQALISYGSVLREARLRDIRRFVSRYGQKATFEGCSTLIVNRRGDGDLGEQIRKLGYQIAYCYIEGPQEGKLVTFVTLFSDQVDVSAIAQKYGGGGHRGAAGFSFERHGAPFPDGASWELHLSSPTLPE
jgi:oligoribonuclease NrnB/cAMP/cGMP phosphodiesterase (DHH superfamily)